MRVVFARKTDLDDTVNLVVRLDENGVPEIFTTDGKRVMGVRAIKPNYEFGETVSVDITFLPPKDGE